MVDSLTLSDDIVRTIDLLVPFIFLLISPGVLWGPEPELEERPAEPEPVLCPLGDASIDLRDGGYYEYFYELREKFILVFFNNLHFIAWIDVHLKLLFKSFINLQFSRHIC